MVPPLAMKGRALVAWNLRRIRVKRGFSQERLAFDSGVDRSYVGGLERQEQNPTVDLLDRLAKTLSVPISDFFVQPARGQKPELLTIGLHAIRGAFMCLGRETHLAALPFFLL